MTECIHGRPLTICAVCAPAADEAYASLREARPGDGPPPTAEAAAARRRLWEAIQLLRSAYGSAVAMDLKLVDQRIDELEAALRASGPPPDLNAIREAAMRMSAASNKLGQESVRRSPYFDRAQELFTEAREQFEALLRVRGPAQQEDTDG